MPTRFGRTSHIIYETKITKKPLDDERLRESFERPNSQSSIDVEFEVNDDELANGHGYENANATKERVRRYIASGGSRKVPHVLFIETAIFVDKDLFRHMAKNYPKNTEGNLIRFVMAMINGV